MKFIFEQVVGISEGLMISSNSNLKPECFTFGLSASFPTINFAKFQTYFCYFKFSRFVLINWYISCSRILLISFHFFCSSLFFYSSFNFFFSTKVKWSSSSFESNFFGFGIGSRRTSIGGQIRWSGSAFELFGRCFKAAYFEFKWRCFDSSEGGGGCFFFFAIGLMTAIGTWLNFGRFFSF